MKARNLFTLIPLLALVISTFTQPAYAAQMFLPFVAGVGACPGQLKAEYYNNRYLTSSPDLVRCETWPLYHDWGAGRPAGGINSDNFSARWSGEVYFAAGSYTFIAAASDGIRVWLDDGVNPDPDPIIDAWYDQSLTEHRATVELSGGNHLIRVEYYEHTGAASVRLEWVKNNAVVVSDRPAFDACVLPNTSQMQTWWDASPYREANIYIGGASRGCDEWNEQYLTPEWVSTVHSQGWNLIPTWVGPQAPCTGYSSRMSDDPQTAYYEGRAEADLAAAAARDLGLTVSGGLGGTIIYYDIEGYTNNAACRSVVKSFMAGWVSRLHELDNRAGGYGAACTSYMSDWLAIPEPPDDIWPAVWKYPAYDANATVWGLPCITDSSWADHQRIRQYAGGHGETWGEVKLNIDSDIADGHVAGYNERGVASLRLAESPASHNIAAAAEKIQAVQLVSDLQGWIISGNRLLWGDSAGQRWQEITPPLLAGATLRSAFFLNDQRGWVLTGSLPNEENFSTLQVGRTGNGGKTWTFAPLNFTPLDGNSTQSQASLSFVDERTGWISIKLASSINFSQGVLFATQDGGKTWVERSQPVGEPVHFIDANTGWVAGGAQGNELYFTHDGGRTWQVRDFAAGEGRFYQYSQPGFATSQRGMIAVAFLDAPAAYTAYTTYYATQDGGETWTPAFTITSPLGQTPSANQQMPINLPGSADWLLPQAAGSPLRSWNLSTGRQHNLQPSTSLAGLQSIQFATPLIGWALVENDQCSGSKTANPASVRICQPSAHLLLTRDGGKTWVEILPLKITD